MRGYKIERGVEIPPITRRGGSLRATLRKMKRGESIRLPKAKSSTAQVTAYNVFGKGGYTIRSNGSHFRIWRIA